MSPIASTEARDRKRAYDRARYAELRALGVCSGCAAADAVPGRVKCAPCLRKAYQATKRRIQKARATATRCHHCASRKRVPGLLYCATCRKKNRDHCRDYQLARRLKVAA